MKQKGAGPAGSTWATMKPRRISTRAWAAAISLVIAGTAFGAEPRSRAPASDDPYPSTYRPLPSSPTLITNAVILDGRGKQIDKGSILLAEGRIAAIGPGIAAPPGANVVDASGKWVTPGIIDVHSHMGVYPHPSLSSRQDGNEFSDPNTAHVWAEHSVWPNDPAFTRALAGGVTAMLVLPGSANLFGGRTVTLKPVPARTVQAMKFPGAPYGLKMTCGENPKRFYGGQGRAPTSRMGSIALQRAAWIEARKYQRSWAALENGARGRDARPPPERDLRLETLAGALNGEILVHIHCYLEDEMAHMIDMAKEFGYRISAFHHAVEAYKIADMLAAENICAATWADRWGTQMELYDAIQENAPWVHKAGACAIVHSDGAQYAQRLNQELAKTLADARKAGVDISKAEAWSWISYNAAKALGIERQTGSLELGKNADVVLWSGDPFSVYSKAEKVFIDGALVWDAANPARRPVSDFELGQPGGGDLK